MKNIFYILAFILSILPFSAIHADSGINSSSSVVNTSTSDNAENKHQNTTSQSTTYTSTTSTTVNSSDDDIVSAIYAKYAKEPAMIGTTLTVSSQNGIVSISGTVNAQAQADEATIAAKSVPGVKDVRSYVKVTTNPEQYKPVKRSNY